MIISEIKYKPRWFDEEYTEDKICPLCGFNSENINIEEYNNIIDGELIIDCPGKDSIKKTKSKKKTRNCKGTWKIIFETEKEIH